MEPPVLAGISVGFVASVDDRPFEGCLEPDLLFEKVGALGQLIVNFVSPLARELGADLAGAGEDLTGDEVRRAVAHDLTKRRVAAYEVILVCAVGVALSVGVVLVEHEFLPSGQKLVSGRHRALDDELAGPVVAHDTERVGALRRGHFGVGVVDVVPGAVAKHCIDEVGFDLRRHCAHGAEPTSVHVGVLVDEVPRNDIGARIGAVTLCR